MEARYAIRVVAELTGLHPQTIRQYERLGLLAPHRSPGGTRYYTDADVERLRAIGQLTQTMGVNLAGVEIILRLREQQSAAAAAERQWREQEAQWRQMEERLAERETALVELLRQVLARLDEPSRAQVEQMLRGNQPGLVRSPGRGLSKR